VRNYLETTNNHLLLAVTNVTVTARDLLQIWVESVTLEETDDA